METGHEWRDPIALSGSLASLRQALLSSLKLDFHFVPTEVGCGFSSFEPGVITLSGT